MTFTKSNKKTGFRGGESNYLQDPNAITHEAHELYQAYDIHEDQERTNVHYEHPPQFFYSFTGGEWNCYSCNLWPNGVTTDTQSQEAKLDRFAELMNLQPGQRILDVGCGWAGPLAYLCKTYGTRGVGLMLSEMQYKAAQDRKSTRLNSSHGYISY